MLSCVLFTSWQIEFHFFRFVQIYMTSFLLLHHLSIPTALKKFLLGIAFKNAAMWSSSSGLQNDISLPAYTPVLSLYVTEG